MMKLNIKLYNNITYDRTNIKKLNNYEDIPTLEAQHFIFI